MIVTTTVGVLLLTRARWQPSATDALGKLLAPGLGRTPPALRPFLTPQADGSIFVRTGDIPEMWIRDSSAQVWPYRDSHPGTAARVLQRQSAFILHDVYANSYTEHWVAAQALSAKARQLGRGGHVGTRNYELDSGCYFIRLLHHLFQAHGLDPGPYLPTVKLLVDTWIVEQRHSERSPYRYPELPFRGLGMPTGYTGMTWTGFRPSDDACLFHYLVPANLFAAVALGHVAEMFPRFERAQVLQREIEEGVARYGTWTDERGVVRYCYEVDGLGGCNQMDDANVPSLLGVPYLDPNGSHYNRTVWEATYGWIWGPKNRFYFAGLTAAGIGSPHTEVYPPRSWIWPMSLIVRGLVDPSVRAEMGATVHRTMAGTGRVHEAFQKDDPALFTRGDFGWGDALLVELESLS